MGRLACIAAAFVLGLAVPSAAQDARSSYDFQERTRALAFDPARFFDDRPEPAISIRYLGDDYGYPVYAIAVHKGCTEADQGEARRTCGARITARMVRAPFEGEPPRPRARGQKLFAMIARSAPRNDDALLRVLDTARLEWFEADVGACPTAMAQLAASRDLKFSAALDPASEIELVLHADKVSFETGDYLMRSRYEGWLKPGSPGAWANDFAKSLAACWKTSAAPVPWRKSGK